MRVVYVGNFKPGHSTETHIARTLEQLGHAVVRLQEDDYLPAGLTRALDAAEPELFLFTRTWGRTVTMEHLGWLRKHGIPSASFHLDLYVGLNRGGTSDPKSAANIGNDPFWATDWVFSPDGDPASQDVFAGLGINHHWLPPGVVADEAYTATGATTSREIVFVGSGPGYHCEHPFRGRLLDWLTSTYGTPRYRQYGGRGHPIRGYRLNRLYAATKIIVGDSCNPGLTHTRYWSDRIPETLGRGGFLIHPRVEGMAEEGFIDGATLATYELGDLTGLRDRIDHYLTHDNERERIRKAGHEHVKANHTYTHRIAQMLDILRIEGTLP